MWNIRNSSLNVRLYFGFSPSSGAMTPASIVEQAIDRSNGERALVPGSRGAP
jgi:hypothetical protein